MASSHFEVLRLGFIRRAIERMENKVRPTEAFRWRGPLHRCLMHGGYTGSVVAPKGNEDPNA